MRQVFALVVSGILLTSCSSHSQSDPAAIAKAREDAGTALAELSPPATAGERLFQVNCAMCHSDGKLYPGTVQLRQHGQPQPALAKRTDLTTDYVQQVVRNGLNTMPAFSPTHLSDADLEKVAAYLASGKSK